MTRICKKCRAKASQTGTTIHHNFLSDHVVKETIELRVVTAFVSLDDASIEKNFTFDFDPSLDEEEIANKIDEKVGDWVYGLIEWGWVDD
jgi:hypothetical protein